MTTPIEFEETETDPKSTTEPLVDSEAKAKRDRTPRKVKTEKPKSPLPPWRAGAISKWVGAIYDSGGTALITLGHADYGQCVKDIAEPAGICWEKLAKRHEWLRRFFDRIMTGSEISEIVWVHFPLFMLMLKDMGLLRPMNFAITEEFADEMKQEMVNRAERDAA